MPVLINARHEMFAHEIAKGASSRDAYKAAGFTTESPGAIDACASRLLKSAKVRARIEEIQASISARVVEKTAVTKAWIIAKLVENVERAMASEPVRDAKGEPTGEYKYNGAVANRALELLGKEEGMFVDRKEIGAPGDFSNLDDAELREFIVSGAAELLDYKLGRGAKRH